MGKTELVHIIVSGRVQGVGYRYHAQFLAKQFQITGWVKNLDDGSVEIMAEGEEKKLEKFIAGLKKGPSRFAKVTELNIEYLPKRDHFKGFGVLY